VLRSNAPEHRCQNECSRLLRSTIAPEQCLCSYALLSSHCKLLHMCACISSKFYYRLDFCHHARLIPSEFDLFYNIVVFFFCSHMRQPHLFRFDSLILIKSHYVCICDNFRSATTLEKFLVGTFKVLHRYASKQIIKKPEWQPLFYIGHFIVQPPLVETFTNTQQHNKNSF